MKTGCSTPTARLWATRTTPSGSSTGRCCCGSSAGRAARAGRGADGQRRGVDADRHQAVRHGAPAQQPAGGDVDRRGRDPQLQAPAAAAGDDWRLPGLHEAGAVLQHHRRHHAGQTVRRSSPSSPTASRPTWILEGERGVPIANTVLAALKPALSRQAAESFELIARARRIRDRAAAQRSPGWTEILTTVFAPKVERPIMPEEITPKAGVKLFRVEASAILARPCHDGDCWLRWWFGCDRTALRSGNPGTDR